MILENRLGRERNFMIQDAGGGGNDPGDNPNGGDGKGDGGGRPRGAPGPAAEEEEEASEEEEGVRVISPHFASGFVQALYFASYQVAAVFASTVRSTWSGSRPMPSKGASMSFVTSARAASLCSSGPSRMTSSWIWRRSV